MKILMTGTSGKVGRVVAQHLAQSHTLLGIDAAAGAFTQIQRDIRDVSWVPLLAGVDAVIHFAALHAPHRETHSEAEFIVTNVEATARLLEVAKACGVRRFILASTTSVYGRAMKGKPRATWVTETLTPESEDIYDETKLAAEALCAEAYAPDFVTMALRFSRCFPESMRDMALYRLYRGVDAQDVAQAFEKAIGCDPEGSPNAAPIGEFRGGLWPGAFNISAPSPFLQQDCNALLTDAASVIRFRAPELAADFLRRGWELPKSIDRVYVIDKAKAQLGFAPVGDYRVFVAQLP
jgi:UDP-glucose 4-epimerase